jgi:hypothetical protein
LVIDSEPPDLKAASYQFGHGIGSQLDIELFQKAGDHAGR